MVPRASACHPDRNPQGREAALLRALCAERDEPWVKLVGMPAAEARPLMPEDEVYAEGAKSGGRSSSDYARKGGKSRPKAKARTKARKAAKAPAKKKAPASRTRVKTRGRGIVGARPAAPRKKKPAKKAEPVKKKRPTAKKAPVRKRRPAPSKAVKKPKQRKARRPGR